MLGPTIKMIPFLNFTPLLLVGDEYELSPFVADRHCHPHSEIDYMPWEHVSFPRCKEWEVKTHGLALWWRHLNPVQVLTGYFASGIAGWRCGLIFDFLSSRMSRRSLTTVCSQQRMKRSVSDAHHYSVETIRKWVNVIRRVRTQELHSRSSW
jgi:hypothetical protein